MRKGKTPLLNNSVSLKNRDSCFKEVLEGVGRERTKTTHYIYSLIEDNSWFIAV